MVQSNLRAAVLAAHRHDDSVSRLGIRGSEVEAWRHAAETVYIPFDESLGMHLQDQDFVSHDVWDFEHTGPEQYPLMPHYPYLTL